MTKEKYRRITKCSTCPCCGWACESVEGIRVHSHPTPCLVPLKYFEKRGASHAETPQREEGAGGL